LLGTKANDALENFTACRTFGNPDVHWLRARVDWRNPDIFQFEPQIVRENVVKH